MKKTTLLLVATAMSSGAFASTAFAQATDTEFFENKIRPLLVEACDGCHTRSRLGGLRVDSREALLEGGESGAAIVPGDAEASRLILAVRHTDPSLEMPKAADKLSEEQIADLVRWIAAGASWPETMQVSEASGGAAEDGYVISEQQRSWWVFQPLSNPEVPAIDGADNDIDRFVLAALREAGLEVSPAASRRDLLRRASYDLLGLPPTFEEIQAFGADPAPDAFEHAIDRMLESPHYGERWGRHWLDVVRFGEDDPRGLAEDGTGVERYETAYTYRGWVIEAFNADVPFDRFVKGQLAGDLLPVEERAGMVAGTGFLGGGPWYIRHGRPSSGAR